MVVDAHDEPVAGPTRVLRLALSFDGTDFEAEAGLEASEFASQSVRDQLAFEVVNAYFNIAKAREVVASTEAAVTSFEENLKVGAHLRKSGPVREGLELVYHYFPRLREKRNETDGFVSGW